MLSEILASKSQRGDSIFNSLLDKQTRVLDRQPVQTALMDCISDTRATEDHLDVLVR